MNTTKFSRIVLSLVLLVAMAVTSLVFASDVDVAVVDVTVPTNGVTLTPGGSTSITINLSVTGNQVGTATFEVYRDWTLSGGTFTGSNPQEFSVAPRAGGDPATNLSTTGTVTVAAGQPAGTFTLAVGVFDITNSNSSGAKLAAGDPSNYVVTVSVPTPPADTTAPVLSLPANITAEATGPAGAVVTYSASATDNKDGNVAVTCTPTSGSTFSFGTTTVSCSATDVAGNITNGSFNVTVQDTIDPVISFVSRTAANGNGWNNSDVTVEWSCSDGGSGVTAASVSQTVSTEGANQSATGTCTDNAGNTASDIVSGINIDKTAPTASASASPAPNTNGWNNTDVTVSFTGSDSLSGVDFCSLSALLNSEGAGQSASGSCTDKAGNTSAQATASGINIDKTVPTVSLDGGPANGASYYFGSVPAAPTCTASDALSGIDGVCSVSGYGTTVGTHTVTASATDKAGNSATASATYNVLAWTLKGFFQPVDMGGVINTVKGGSTVPLKFEVFAGSTELTSTSVVASFVQTKVSCDSSAVVDEVEVTTTGGTSLRYDTTGGQFIQNWQTPKTAGACYRVTMTTLDGSTISANFRLK